MISRRLGSESDRKRETPWRCCDRARKTDPPTTSTTCRLLLSSLRIVLSQLRRSWLAPITDRRRGACTSRAVSADFVDIDVSLTRLLGDIYEGCRGAEQGSVSTQRSVATAESFNGDSSISTSSHHSEYHVAINTSSSHDFQNAAPSGPGVGGSGGGMPRFRRLQFPSSRELLHP